LLKTKHRGKKFEISELDHFLFDPFFEKHIGDAVDIILFVNNLFFH